MSEPVADTAKRLTTSIEGLDAVLGGGFLPGNTYIVMGPPGAGKTILANQIAFHQAGRGKKALYVTVLAETHGMMLEHLRGLAFFDEALVSDALVYFSGYAALHDGGLEGLLERAHRLLRQAEPDLLVFDGMATAEALSGSTVELKEFVHDLQQLVRSYGCTALLLTHAYDTSRERAEHTMVDGILELFDTTRGVRAWRELQVHKARGTRQLRGRHFFEITGRGLTAYPRTEVRLNGANVDGFDASERRLVGIETLDRMLGGGLHARSTSLVLGNSGSGKTLLGLNFLAAGARGGETGLYFGFGEPPAEVVAKADAAGLGFGAHVDEGRIDVRVELPLEVALDPLAERILAAVESLGAKRLFLDGLQGFEQTAIYPERLPRFTAALMYALRARGVTTLLSSQTRSRAFAETGLLPESVESVAGTIIHLRQLEVGAKAYRLVSVAKMRHGSYDSDIREFTISGEGMRVAATSESAERILAGAPHASPSSRTPSPRGEETQ